MFGWMVNWLDRALSRQVGRQGVERQRSSATGVTGGLDSE